jgi:hypothetical protein
MLHLLKMWLKTPVEETDERGTRRMRGGCESFDFLGYSVLQEHTYREFNVN